MKNLEKNNFLEKETNSLEKKNEYQEEVTKILAEVDSDLNNIEEINKEIREDDGANIEDKEESLKLEKESKVIKDNLINRLKSKFKYYAKVGAIVLGVGGPIIGEASAQVNSSFDSSNKTEQVVKEKEIIEISQEEIDDFISRIEIDWAEKKPNKEVIGIINELIEEYFKEYADKGMVSNDLSIKIALAYEGCTNIATYDTEFNDIYIPPDLVDLLSEAEARAIFMHEFEHFYDDGSDYLKDVPYIDFVVSADEMSGYRTQVKYIEDHKEDFSSEEDYDIALSYANIKYKQHKSEVGGMLEALEEGQHLDEDIVKEIKKKAIGSIIKEYKEYAAKYPQGSELNKILESRRSK